MQDATDMTLTKPSLTMRSALLRSSMMTRAERTQGRFMRAPDGHDAAPPAGDTAPPAGDAPPADISAAPAGDAAPQGDDTVLGGEAAAKDGDDATKDAAAETAGAPEAYDLKAPEGMEFDAEALAIAEPILRELNLDNDKAQKLTDAYSQIVPKIAERIETARATDIAAQRAAWAAEAKADPEIGGANWTSSVAASAKALDALGAPAGSPFRELLNASGLGNHPEMIRMFVKVGKAVGEDPAFIDSKATKAKTTEDKFYGTA